MYDICINVFSKLYAFDSIYVGSRLLCINTVLKQPPFLEGILLIVSFVVFKIKCVNLIAMNVIQRSVDLERGSGSAI